MVWSLNRCNGHKFWYFKRNSFNQYVDSFKILFEASSQACSAILPTIWRRGFTLDKLQSYWWSSLLINTESDRVVYYFGKLMCISNEWPRVWRITRPPPRTVSKNCHYWICGQEGIDNMTERKVALLGSIGLLWLNHKAPSIQRKQVQVVLAKQKKNLITGPTSATRGNLYSRWKTVKPGLHIVVTIAEYACDHVLKRVLKLLIYRSQIFLVKYEYLRSLQQCRDQCIPGKLKNTCFQPCGCDPYDLYGDQA